MFRKRLRIAWAMGPGNVRTKFYARQRIFLVPGTHQAHAAAVVPSSVQNSCGIYVGRLLEIRILAGYRTSREVDELYEEIRAELTKIKEAQRVVIISDWRFCPPLSDEISKLLRERAAASHPRAQAAAAIVLKDSPADVVQTLQLIQENTSPTMRLFFEVPELLSWVHPFLTGAEFRRLRTFVVEGTSMHLTVANAVPRGGRASPRDCG